MVKFKIVLLYRKLFEAGVFRVRLKKSRLGKTNKQISQAPFSAVVILETKTLQDN